MRASVVIDSSDWNPDHRIQLRDVVGEVRRQAEDVGDTEVVLVLAEAHSEHAPSLRAEYPGFRVIEAPPGMDYYEHKHLGAGHAIGEVLLFVDANCLPTTGWIQVALRAVQRVDGEPAAVQGKTRFDAGALSRMFDVVWWAWSLRQPGEIPCLYASNNLALGASVYREQPFDTAWPYHTGQERHYGRKVAENGATLVFAPEMLVHHNYAEGVRAFVLLALVWGYFFWENRRTAATRTDRVIRGLGLFSTLVVPPVVWLRYSMLLVRNWSELGFSRTEIWKLPGLILLLLTFSLIMPLGMLAAMAGRKPFPRPS